MPADIFWKHIKEKWQPASEEQLRGAAHAVLFHLRRRLPHEEVQALFSELPGEVVGLSFDVAYLKEFPARRHPPERHQDAPEFFSTVGREASLSEDDAARATEAIFGAMKQELPAKQINAVHAMLPKQLGEVWSRA
ncbi:MAG: DUF2267 domain-containing protein [Thiohalomonadaceae bacterium]